MAHEKENCLPYTKVSDDVKAKARAPLETNRLSKEAKEQKLQTEKDEVVIDDNNCLFSESSTSSNKGLMDRHVYTQALPKINRKGEKVQTLNQHWKKKAREDACEWITEINFENAVPFNIVSFNSWRQIMEAAGKYGKGLKGPLAYEFG